MRAHRDPDLLLVETMLAPPPLEDSRRSLEFWQRRQKALPLYRRAAKREAREMAARWQERVQAAERIRFEASVLGRILAVVGLSRLFELRSRVTKRGVLALAWMLVPPQVKLAAAAIVVAWVVVLIATLAAVAMFAHFA